MNAHYAKKFEDGLISSEVAEKCRYEVTNLVTIQYAVYRLLACLSIYLSATESIYLKKGLPGSHLSSISMVDRLTRPQAYILNQTDTIKKSSGSSPEEHYRIFHFRNLRAEKFYQGEYKHLPQGSRWVFVKDSLVNSKANGHTPWEIG